MTFGIAGVPPALTQPESDKSVTAPAANAGGTPAILTVARTFMIHQLHFPRPPLSQFVENIWLVEGNHPEHTREKLLPDGASN